ncbi:hypothetical protein PF005_g20691 [Phytophthora fragariae]|uniref:FYVE-type domain-containing protein n=1 Tax=Phytophthora fragariae TaxID=53985 RepID=A0A6A3WKZ8_9STRA|nr:hypothetical protein PF003_g13138 [Phytophthora fragariae]KAE8987888.1 hypothetical protein PF011_g19395 [Phytophthora fragariae]KAE9086503.1 hypothetical protein PF007_g20749 [Phytophthora fragariae]KAE9113784.1 hypothetical protein PF006_g19662 [Phytophthora fragariae]KAE9186838.1 hypothetical protein PF005_g20691 [Phytophthora fragariae]
MRKEWIGQNPYSDLHLSAAIKHQLVDLVNEFVDGYFQQYEDFVAIDNRQVNKQRWKHLKSKDDLHVYEDRCHQETDQDMEPWQPVSSQGGAAPTKSDMPVLLRVGTVLGRLDDLMFGCVNPTMGTMRIRASYVHDVHTAAVLCPVIEPSKEEPFRSLIVKWLTLDNPFESTNLVKTRDFVYIEATGILHFANGDQVGYHLKHSVEFPETTPRPSIIRAKMSYCGFFRQVNTNVIDVFGTSTTVPGGDIRRFIANRVATDSLLSTNNLVFCGQMKKMSWMLQQQRNVGLQREGNKNCVVCNKNTASGIRGRFGKSTCKLCYGSVCFSCKIHWRISFIAPGGKLIRRKIAFCASCVTRASFCDAKQAARDQATGYRAYKVFSTASHSDTAELSEFSADSHADLADMLDWECL